MASWPAALVRRPPFFRQSFLFCPGAPQCYLITCAVPGLAESAQTGMVASQSGLRRDGGKGFCPSSRCQTLVKLQRWILSLVKPTIHRILTTDRPCPKKQHRYEFAVTVPRVPFLHQTRWLGNPEQPSFFPSSFPSLALLFSATQTGPHRAVWRDPFSTHGIFHGTIRNSTQGVCATHSARDSTELASPGFRSCRRT